MRFATYCHGTKFEWCSSSVTTTTSPGPRLSKPQAYATRLIPSVALRVKIDLALARRVEELRDLRASSLVAGGRVLGELVDAAVDVRVRRLVERRHRVEHLARLLRRGRRVEERERLPVDLLLEDREVGAQPVRVQLLRCLDGHAPIVRAVTSFAETVAAGYAVEGAALDLGRGVHDGKLERDAVVRLPLATSNRHGLIAGATGTGKTRTLQLLAEQLSDAGVAVFAADYKGDLSGLAVPAPAEGKARRADGRARPPVRAGRVPGRVPRRSAGSAPASRSARPSPTSGRSSSRRCSARTRRRSRASRSSSATPTSAGWRSSTSPTCARCSRSSSRRRARTTSRGSAASRSRRSACCSARWSSSRTAAAPSSSASRSSRSPTCCGRRPTAAAS